MSIQTRNATSDDADVVYELLLAHAGAIGMPFKASKAELTTLLFSGVGAPINCILAEVEGEAVGFLIWYYNFSTFTGSRGMYVEDIYVKPAARPLGVAGVLASAVDTICMEQRLPRREWLGHDDNHKATAYFVAAGGFKLQGWSAWRKEFSFS